MSTCEGPAPATETGPNENASAREPLTPKSKPRSTDGLSAADGRENAEMPL